MVFQCHCAAQASNLALQQAVVTLGVLHEALVECGGLVVVTEAVGYVGGIVERPLTVLVGAGRGNCHIVRQGFLVLSLTEIAVGKQVVGLHGEEAVGELVQVVLQAGSGILKVALLIASLDGEEGGAVLLHGGDGNLGGALHVAEVLVHTVLLYVYVLHRTQRVSRLVGTRILRQQAVEGLKSFVGTLGVIVYQTLVEQRGLHIDALRILLDEVVVVGHSHLVVVAHHIGVGNLEHGLRLQWRVVVSLEYVVEVGELVTVLALRTIGEGFLVGGVVGILAFGVYHFVILHYALRKAAIHIQTVTHAVVYVVAHHHRGLVFRFGNALVEFSKRLEGFIVALLAHQHVGIGVAGLVGIGRRAAVRRQQQLVQTLLGRRYLAVAVLPLAHQVVGVGGDTRHSVDLHRFLIHLHAVFFLAAVAELYASVEQSTLVGLLEGGIALRHLLKQPDGFLVVVGGAVELGEYLFSLCLVATLGVFLQVVLERFDAAAHGVLVELTAQLGIVEEGVFLDLLVVVHLAGHLEHAAGVHLAAHAHITVAEGIEGVLRHTVAALHLAAQVYGGRVVAAQHIVAVAHLVVVVLRRAAGLLLLFLLSASGGVVLKGQLVLATVEVHLADHLLYLAALEGVLVLQ